MPFSSVVYVNPSATKAVTALGTEPINLNPAIVGDSTIISCVPVDTTSGCKSFTIPTAGAIGINVVSTIFSPTSLKVSYVSCILGSNLNLGSPCAKPSLVPSICGFTASINSSHVGASRN